MKKFLLLKTMLSGPAFAQAGLYAPAPLADSAFVRVIGAAAATLNAKSVTGQKEAATAYVVIPQGSVTVKIGGRSRPSACRRASSGGAGARQ